MSIPVIFDGMLDRNVPLPTFRIPRGVKSPASRVAPDTRHLRPGPALSSETRA